MKFERKRLLLMPLKQNTKLKVLSSVFRLGVTLRSLAPFFKMENGKWEIWKMTNGK
jgi:hypothetical protein